MKGPHTGENQAEILIAIIKEYDLSKKIGYFVTDNATNNDVAIDCVLKELMPELTNQRRKARRLRCLGHVINLAAKAFLFGLDENAFDEQIELAVFKGLVKELQAWRKMGPVGKLHNTVKFICRTPQRRGKFNDIGKLNNDEKGAFDHLNLLIDNATRWNSLYSMIERALKLRDRIDSFCIDHANQMHDHPANKRAQTPEEQEQLLKNDALTGEDWEVLSEVMAFLEPFQRQTKRSESAKGDSSRGCLSDYITTLNLLIRHVKTARDDVLIRCTNPDLASPGLDFLKACIINCWNKIDVYFDHCDTTGAVYSAVVTQPKSKFVYFETRWHDEPTWKHRAKLSMNSVWAEYRNLDLTGTGDAGGVRQRSPSPLEDEMDMTRVPEAPRDQLEQWIKDPPFKLEGSDSLVSFWLRKRRVKATANLAQMALDMASIPAMSSECERVFSQAKLMITGQRHRLKSDIIEASQCLRAWLIADRKKAGVWTKRGNKSEDVEFCMVPNEL